MGRADLRTLASFDPGGRRVLVRTDFNVPLSDGEIGDDRRIVATLPTLRRLLDDGAALVLASHLGRPDGRPDPALSLRPVGQRLQEALDGRVTLAPDSVGHTTEHAAAALAPGEILLLENTRFHSEEERNDQGYAAALAELADYFVNDAFGTLHRAHASTVGVAAHLPSAAGLLVEKELAALDRAARQPARPYVVLIGGAKIDSKLPALRKLLARADRVLVGGGVANTLLAASGHALADSLLEDDCIGAAEKLLETAGERLVLPVDIVIADGAGEDATLKVVPVGDLENGWRIVDIGPQTVALFEHEIAAAATTAWSGPLGRFEIARFSKGTFAIARALADAEGYTIVGGGETASAVRAAEAEAGIDHISTGGGASLAYLCGDSLPGLEVLRKP